MTEKIIKFRPYPFELGQKIYIESGPRRGDWEVIGINEKNVRLRCPVTRKEVEWAAFCYFVEAAEVDIWPHAE
jgi:Fe-S cluster biosynthesis and repair protein YggX